MFLNFGGVGMSERALVFGVTFLLKEKVKIKKYPANPFVFFPAASSNFILNRLWTFQSDDPAVGFQYLKFLTVSVVGVLISNAMIYMLHERLKWNFYFAKLVSIGFVLFWNFFASYFFTFTNG